MSTARAFRSSSALSLRAVLVFAFSLTWGCSDSVLTESCPPERVLCGENCIDLQNDAMNCGGCNLACPDGQICSAGSCQNPCPEGYEECRGDCVRLGSDPDNCGGCGIACPPDQVCTNGVCAYECDGGLSVCGAACVDLENDEANCGDCNQRCPSERSCEGGRCVCPEGSRDCGDSCVDTDSDPKNCGRCGKVCGDDEACVDGQCACPHGACDGVCMDLRSDAENCGSCGVVCPQGTTCEDGVCLCPGATFCDGACIDTQFHPKACGDCDNDCTLHGNIVDASCEGGSCAYTCAPNFADCTAEPGCETHLPTDNQHCGACDNACALGTSCSNGICCAPELQGCNGECVDTGDSAAHCGACGNDCSRKANIESGACEEGSCEVVCLPGFADCNEDGNDGCEAHLGSDPNHCGACGKRCPAGCVNGVCTAGTFASRYYHSCFLQETDNTLWCWGSNEFGQLATGDRVHSPVPVKIGLENVVDFALRERGVCAVLGDGTVWCWGDAYNGNGEMGEALEPVQVIGIENAVQVGGGMYMACALLEDTTVRCWGPNPGGSLGDGTDEQRLEPVTVMEDALQRKPLTGVAQISPGYSNNCARMRNGTVKCWGDNQSGQNGQGTGGPGSENVFNPTPGTVLANEFMQLTGVIQISGGGGAGSGFISALMADGTVRTWGRNSHGALGIGHTQSNIYPFAQKVVDIENAVRVESGTSSACAILADGTARCWGNTTGFGPGFTLGMPRVILSEDCETPLQDVQAIGTGYEHGCAMLGDGSIHCWGRNSKSQIGFYDPGPSNEPARCAIPFP